MALFGKAAALIKESASRVGVIHVEANGIRRPRFSDALGFFQTPSPNPLALPCRCDGHRQKIDGPLALREVTGIDRPRFFGGKTERRDNRRLPSLLRLHNDASHRELLFRTCATTTGPCRNGSLDDRRPQCAEPPVLQRLRGRQIENENVSRTMTVASSMETSIFISRSVSGDDK